jgi:thiol-disulfide isomerase/thioredoxin
MLQPVLWSDSKEGTMLTLQTVVMLAASVAGETMLIDFSADWCGPCRQMEPVVQQLSQMGYPVRKVNVDHEPGLVSQFKVTGFPTFLLVVDGREVDRKVGATSLAELEQMLTRHGVGTGSSVREARGQSPDPGHRRSTFAEPASSRGAPRATPASTSANSGGMAAPLDEAGLHKRLMAASVRLKIDDPQGHSYGSGTIIGTSGEDAVVLTCGHIFRDSGGKGDVSVDLFGSEAPHGIAGRILCYDLKSDVGLVSFRPGCHVVAAPVAEASYQVRRGNPVINIGCNNGGEPSLRTSHVTSLDKFLGPPNLQVAGQPVQGRSGGGLFSADGRVIGVCNAADPADNEGLYAALPSIWSQLERIGWGGDASQTSRDEMARRRRNAAPAPQREASEPEPLPTTTSAAPLMANAGPANPSNTSIAGPINQAERGALAAIQQRSSEAEVICIVRSAGDPQSKSEVIVLDKVSAEFLARLAAERNSQDSRHLTSLAVGRSAAVGATATVPAQHASATAVRPCPVDPKLVTPASNKSAAGQWRPQWLKPR